MAFQLKTNESVRKGIRRIVRDELEGALKELHEAESSDEAVHGVRKRFKRLRAVVRLVRDALGEDRYREENSCFRDAARPLTEVRDAKVLIEALDNLSQRFACEVSAAAFSAPRQGLERHRDAVRAAVLEQQHAGSAAIENIEHALAKLRECKIDGLDWSVLRQGMKRAYKKSQAAFDVALAEPTTANFHEWRKQVKYFWHQIEIVERVRPAVMKKMAARVHELTQLLGDDHDLAILRETVSGDVEAYGGAKMLDSLLPILERRRGRLEREAVALQERIFREKPKAFIARIDRYWKKWR